MEDVHPDVPSPQFQGAIRSSLVGTVGREVAVFNNLQTPIDGNDISDPFQRGLFANHLGCHFRIRLQVATNQPRVTDLY